MSLYLASSFGLDIPQGTMMNHLSLHRARHFLFLMNNIVAELALSFFSPPWELLLLENQPNRT